MALVITQYCNECARFMQHTNGKCDHCSERERREVMAAWMVKTTDEKLLDIHRRLLRLEAGPPTY